MVVAFNLQAPDKIKTLGQLRYDCKGNEEYIDWLRETPDRIIHHIIYTHHAYVKHEFPKIGPLLFSILRTHGNKHMELIEIYLLFNDLKIELENHIVREEELIFPAMMLFEGNKTNENRKQLLEHIYEIEGEHRVAGDLIRNIRMLTEHFTLPMDACRTFALAYQKLAEIENNIFQHMHIVKLFYLKTLKEYIEHGGFIYNS